MYEINCPYCYAHLNINHDDGYGYKEDEIYEQECEECGKIFIYTTSIIFSHDVRKADCKNGGEHDWVTTVTYPKMYTKMRCSICGEKRDATDEEKKKYDIPVSLF